MKREEKSKRSKEEMYRGLMKDFSIHGYEKTSLSRICEENNISKGRLYYHFANKDALVLASVQWCYDTLKELNFAIRFDQCADLGEKLRAIFHARQELFLISPYTVPFMWIIINDPPAHLVKEISKFRCVLIEWQANTVQKICLESGMPPEDVELFTEIYDTASYRVHFLNRSIWNPEGSREDLERNIAEAEKTFDKLVHIFLYGILPR